MSRAWRLVLVPAVTTTQPPAQAVQLTQKFDSMPTRSEPAPNVVS